MFSEVPLLMVHRLGTSRGTTVGQSSVFPVGPRSPASGLPGGAQTV